MGSHLLLFLSDPFLESCILLLTLIPAAIIANALRVAGIGVFPAAARGPKVAGRLNGSRETLIQPLGRPSDLADPTCQQKFTLLNIMQTCFNVLNLLL